MGSKDDAYSAFDVYRVCFACGRTERVDVENEGSPLLVKRCEDCGARMYMLQGVEAYFDRFFGDSAFSDDALSSLEFADVPALPEGGFEVELMDSRLRFRVDDSGFISRFKRCLEVSKRHAFQMLRSEAELLTCEWKSPVMGVFRPRGRKVADTLVGAMFESGRFTLTDARFYAAEIQREGNAEVVIREAGEHRLAIKEGFEDWFSRAFEAVGSDRGRRAAVIATACTLGLESTAAAAIAPANVIRDKDLKQASDLIAMKARAAFGDTCSMEITDDGKLVLSAESKSSDDLERALAAAGVARVEVVGDGIVLADARSFATPALVEELKQASNKSLEPELRKGLQDVLGALASAAAKRKDGEFATIDDVRGVVVSDILAFVKELHDRGYIEVVTEGWAYRLTEKGKSVMRGVLAGLFEVDTSNDSHAEFKELCRELMHNYDKCREKWIKKYFSDEGFDEWFTGQLFPNGLPKPFRISGLI